MIIKCMNSMSIKSVVLLFIFQFVYIGSAAWADYPTQSERFKGMGATFKKAKKNSEKDKSTSDDVKQNENNAQDEILETEIESSGNYFKLHTFVVNVSDQSSHKKISFLTLDVYCEIRDDSDKNLINNHIAPIKDAIITHISGIDRKDIQTPKQKKALQNTLTQKVSDVLYSLTGKKSIIQLYITRMLID